LFYRKLIGEFFSHANWHPQQVKNHVLAEQAIGGVSNVNTYYDKGNSGSGKSSVAKILQRKIGRNTLLISQDILKKH